MKTIVLERSVHDALLMKEDRHAIEKYIIAHDYDPISKTWGYGSYYRDLLEAAYDWDRIKQETFF